MKKTSEYEIVEVVWRHAIPVSGKWVMRSELPKPLYLRTIGYLVVDRENYITLASEYDVTDPDNMTSQVISIPRTSIEQIIRHGK